MDKPQIENSGSVPLIIPVDREHSGIRAVGCVSFLVIGAIAFLLTLQIIRDAVVIAIFAGLGIAALSTYALDRFLQRRWPSGREVQISDAEIRIAKHNQTERSINPQQQVNVLLWHFSVTRNSRARKGWHVVACSLEQDGAYLPVYSFGPPEKTKELPFWSQFTALQRKSKKIDAASDRELKLAGEQRRLHQAELDRGDAGAEMTLEQFTEYIAHLQKQFPRWMPQK